MQHKTATIPYYRVLILDMDESVLSDTAHASEYDADVALATARDAGMVPPGGRAKVEAWASVFRLTDDGWKWYHETLG